MEMLQFRVARIVEESEGVRTLILDGDAPPYRPGNFFRLYLLVEGKKTFRPYSAASHPSEKGLRLCIKKNGAFSSRVWGLKEGDLVEMDGPFGTFVLDKKDGERVFVAGGVGIAPLRPMIIQTLMEGKRASLFHSARTLQDVTYIGEMKALEIQNRNFRYFPAVTREKMPEGWGGLNRRLAPQAIAGSLGGLDGKAYYICGPPEMVASIARELQVAGMPKDMIKKEEWG